MAEKDVFNDLSRLVEELTTSGRATLDENVFKQVKNICKTSDDLVRHLYRLVMTQLEKDHAEIRLSCLQIIIEIFQRSHIFRVLVTDNLRQLLLLTVGLDSEKCLPEPYNVATTLQHQAIQAMQKWNQQFGQYYNKLSLGYKYLAKVKQITFDNIQRNATIQQNQTQNNRTLSSRKKEKVSNEMTEIVPEINIIITEIENCFQILLPAPENFDIYNIGTIKTKKDYQHPSTSNDYCDTDEVITNNHTSNDLNITISKNVEIVENDENTDVLNTLREHCKYIKTRYIPLVQTWLTVLTKHSGCNERLVEAIDLKNTLLGIQEKFEMLKIKTAKVKTVASEGKVLSDDDNDEPFIDVPEKFGVENTIQEHNNSLKTSENTSKDKKKSMVSPMVDTVFWSPNGVRCHAELADPSSRASAIAKARAQLPNQEPDSQKTVVKASHNMNLSNKDSKRKELFEKAPVLPFDMDLYHWGEKSEEAPSVSSLKSLHCFWVHGNEDNEDHCPDDMRESLKSRSMKFTGEFQEIKRSCRAPLSNGKLCPRKDRFKCPFHGAIVPRDETGKPSESTSCAHETQTKIAGEHEQITKDIELATGLTLTKKEKRGKKRKHSGLTDLKKASNTSRSRLEKIVFDKKSLARVADENDRVKKKLIDEKFGNNWNYALSRTY